MFGSVNQSYRIQNPTLSCASAFVRQSRTFHSITALCTFYRKHTFLNWRNILSWIPFVSDLDPNRVCKWRERERERERERLVQARQSKHCIGGSTSTERERDVCVCVFFLNFVSLFFLLWKLVYVFQFCVDLCKKKIWSYEMSSGINSWVESRTQNYWVRGTILAGIRSRQSERKRGRTK